MLNPSWMIRLTIAFILASLLPCPGFQLHGQDLAQLAVKARDNLYEHWDFERAAYYFDQVIGKKYTPAFAYSDYGWYLWLIDGPQKGMKYIRQAAVMAPQDKQMVTWYAWALQLEGDLDQARSWIKRALKIDINYGEALHVKSRVASDLGEHEEAIELAEKAAKSDRMWLGIIPLALAKAGKDDEALKRANAIAESDNAFDVFHLAELYALWGEEDKALYYLEKSYELRHPFLPWINFYSSLENLHGNPKFHSIVSRLNLP